MDASRFTLSSPLLQQNAASDCLEITVDDSSAGSATPSKCTPWAAFDDLDEFVRTAYQYYTHRGLLGWALTQAVHLAMLAIVFALFILLAFLVDYGRLMRARDLRDAVLAPPFLAWLAIAACGAAWCLKGVQSVWQVRRMLAMRHHFHLLFLSDDAQLAALSWRDVVVRALCRAAPLHTHTTEDVTGRLLRVEHFMLGMHQAGIFRAFGEWQHGALGEWQHGAVPHSMLSHPFLWLAWFTIIPLVMDHAQGRMRDTGAAAMALRHRMVLVGIVALCVSPLVLVFVLLYYVLQYGEQLRHRPLFLGSRHWSMEAVWDMRRWHEAPHELRARLALASPPARAFSESQASPALVPLAQLGTFCCSAVCVLLLALALIDDDVLLRQELFGRALVWWLAMAGAGLAVSRACMPEPPTDASPDDCLKDVARHTGMRLPLLRAAWRRYYEYRAVGFLWEVLSVVLAPVLFLTVMPHRAMRIASFLATNTHQCDRIGPVCSLSLDPAMPIVDMTD